MAPLGVSFHLLTEDQGLVLSAILVPFDSTWFMLCPWAMSFFQKLRLASFPPVTFPLLPFVPCIHPILVSTSAPLFLLCQYVHLDHFGDGRFLKAT